MIAGIYFTGSGPILILTSYGSLTDGNLVEKLATKGINKFIAYEVAEDIVKEKYGRQYSQVMTDVREEDDLRVLDYDGHHVFHKFAFKDLGDPKYHEP